MRASFRRRRFVQEEPVRSKLPDCDYDLYWARPPSTCRDASLVVTGAQCGEFGDEACHRRKLIPNFVEFGLRNSVCCPKVREFHISGVCRWRRAGRFPLRTAVRLRGESTRIRMTVTPIPLPAACRSATERLPARLRRACLSGARQLESQDRPIRSGL